MVISYYSKDTCVLSYITFTFRAFGACFYPKQLTKSTFVEGDRYYLKCMNSGSGSVQKEVNVIFVILNNYNNLNKNKNVKHNYGNLPLP